MRSGGFAGWAVALGLLLTPTFLVGAMLATPGYFTLPSQTALGTILGWLIAATLISGERWSRNPRRHFALRSMQHRLEAEYAASPGPIPAGPVVRLGDSTPIYAPAGPPELTYRGAAGGTETEGMAGNGSRPRS